MRGISLLAVLLFVVGTASAQTPTQKELKAASDSVVAAIAAKKYDRLAGLVGREGIVLYYCFPDRSKRWPNAAAFRNALNSKTQITWLPAMQGDGGMRDAVKMSLRQFLDSVATTKWSKAKPRYGSSPEMIYRTLFIADLQPEHRGSRFLDLTLLHQREFKSALILGFKRERGTLRLTAIGFDQFKD